MASDLARYLNPFDTGGSRKRESSAPPRAGVGQSPIIDPIIDATTQLASLQAYFAVIASGGNPTASQLAAAQGALGALQADLRAMQQMTSDGSAAGRKMWVSAGAAGVAMAASAAVGGVVGWIAGKESK